MDETLGNIKVVRMIWVQTLGVLGSLLFCVLPEDNVVAEFWPAYVATDSSGHRQNLSEQHSVPHRHALQHVHHVPD
jgi:hypothetical protein